jgi:hypothetical protein
MRHIHPLGAPLHASLRAGRSRNGVPVGPDEIEDAEFARSVQIVVPSPRPFLYSKSAISEVVCRQLDTAGSQFPTKQPNRGVVTGSAEG